MTIPDEILEALSYEIARADLECDDNYRAYRLRDSHLRPEFMISQRKGCCGVFETSYVDNAGDKWIMACNYGH